MVEFYTHYFNGHPSMVEKHVILPFGKEQKMLIDQWPQIGHHSYTKNNKSVQRSIKLPIQQKEC